MNRPSPSRVRVSGPLKAYAAGFREELSALGYSARSAAGHLQLMAHLSRWLVEIGLAPEDEIVAIGTHQLGGHHEREGIQLIFGSARLGSARPGPGV